MEVRSDNPENELDDIVVENVQRWEKLQKMIKEEITINDISKIKKLIK